MQTEPTPTASPGAVKRRALPHHAYSPEYRAEMALLRLMLRAQQHIEAGDAARAQRLLTRAEAAHIDHQPSIPYTASRVLADGLYLMRCLVASMASREADVRGQMAVLAELRRENAALRAASVQAEAALAGLVEVLR